MDEQSRLVPRYVAGDLSRSERAEFEAMMIASPELASEVEMERRLRRGMASAARRGWLDQSAPPASTRTPPRRHAHLAIAATALLTMGLAVSLTMPRLDDEAGVSRLTASTGPGLLAARSVQLGKFRGAGRDTDVLLRATQMPSELILEPDVVVLTCENGAVELECATGGQPQFPQYPEYDLAVVSSRGESLQWRSERQRPALAASAPLAFRYRDVSELKPGDYEIRVRGVSAEHEEIVGRFTLRVTE